jgi:hypothetical protein
LDGRRQGQARSPGQEQAPKEQKQKQIVAALEDQGISVMQGCKQQKAREGRQPRPQAEYQGHGGEGGKATEDLRA